MFFTNTIFGIVSSGGSNPSPTLDAATSDVNLVFDGNSLTNGTSHAGISQYYPKQVDANFDGAFQSKTFNSFGVNGQTMEDMIADADTQIYSLVDPNKVNILVAWEDVNGIYGGFVTAQERYNSAITYTQGAKDAGFDYVILLTGYYPRKDEGGGYWYGGTNMTTKVNDNEPTHEALLDMLNAADIDSVPWDYIIDLRNDPDIGGVKGQTRNTHFGDYIHLNASGYDIVASYVIGVINNIFGL